MLSNMRAFRVPDIIVKRFVLDGSIKRYGRDDQGEVLLTNTDLELHVKIRQGLEIMDTIVPLAERFAERFDLGDTSRELLAKVLTTERVEQFIEGLERAGVRITPTTIVEVATELGFDEDSDDAIHPQEPHESLGLAFKQLQISEGMNGGVPDWESQEIQEERPSPAPGAQSRRRSHAGISSPISLRRRSAFISNSEAEATPITTTSPSATTETVARLTERLINAKLSDATHDVFRQRSTTPIPSGEGSSESRTPVFGTGNSFRFTFDPPALHPHVTNADLDASNQTGTDESGTSRILVDNSLVLNTDSDPLYSSSDHTNGGLVTPSRRILRASGHLSPGRSFRNSYGESGFVNQESTADTPQEIGHAGEHLVRSIRPCQVSHQLSNKKV